MNYKLREKRIVEVNAILATFVPSIHIYDAFTLRRSVILRMCWDHRKGNPKHNFPADLRSDGSWPRYGYDCRPTGGTGLQALAQLIRYVRDLTRLPILTWEYWCGEKIGLGNTETLRLIRESEYGDPTKTCCIFCGTTEWKNGLDWYSYEGKIGPGCGWNTCQKLDKPRGRNHETVPS